jgi:hypothetical protein
MPLSLVSPARCSACQLWADSRCAGLQLMQQFRAWVNAYARSNSALLREVKAELPTAQRSHVALPGSMQHDAYVSGALEAAARQALLAHR